MVKRIAISIGHNPDSPGFKNHNVSEYSEMAILAGLVVNKIQRACHKAFFVGTGSLRKKVAEVNAYHVDCAIELHLNAGGAQGYETLYCPGSTRGRALASKVNAAMGIVINSKNRGVKEGWYKMDPKNGPNYFLEKTNCPAIITEIFFLDNETERAKFVGSLNIMDAVASRIAVGILTHLTEN